MNDEQANRDPVHRSSFIVHRFWPLRIALSKLRPFNGTATLRVAIVAVVFGAFLYGDFKLFARLFHAVAQVETATPFFALGVLRNLLSMVFLTATIVLFSSS